MNPAPEAMLERVVARVRALPEGARIVVLAGPGVPAGGDGAVAGLRLLAVRAGLGVVNTWGAKGLFAWDDPHHLGTAGLQARDFELAGLADVDLIVATGLDSHEAPSDRWQLAPHVRVRPRALADLAEAWPLPPGRPERPLLYTRLAEVVQPLSSSDKVPLAPARAVFDLKEALPPGGAVFADPGLAGFWLARAFPTSRLGSVEVPAVGEPGYAAWAALQAARSGRSAVAVTDAPPDLDTEDALAYAAASGISFVLLIWGSGQLPNADAHRHRLANALGDRHLRVLEVPVDWSDTDLLIDVAGEIVAWAP